VFSVSDATPGENPLAPELEIFDAHRTELLAAAAGKFALVHGSEIAGTFEAERDAIAAGYRRYGNVPFLVKQVLAEESPEHFVTNVIEI